MIERNLLYVDFVKILLKKVGCVFMLLQLMRIFECEFCDKMFSHKGNLNTHIGYIHDAKNSFVCRFCQK